MRTPTQLLAEVEDRNDLWRVTPKAMLEFFAGIQDEAMTAERRDAEAGWKPQVERLTQEVIVLRGYIDRLHAIADEAKTMAVPF